MVDNLIRLFDSAETQFTSNGLGVLLDAESCIVSEEKNGEFELELVYPITGRKYSDILMRRIIVAKSNPYSNPQPFRIYSISKPLNGRVTINAEHISYDMSGYPVEPFTATSCSDAFVKMKEASAVACPFSFWTDKNVIKDYSTKIPFSMRSLLGGTDGSILQAFGKGEYEFDGYSVKFWLNRGYDRGVVIRYGKNLTDIKQEEKCSNVYTGVFPFWYNEGVSSTINNSNVISDLIEQTSQIINNDNNEEPDLSILNSNLVILPEKIVQCEGTFNYSRILTLDLSDKWTDKPSVEDLRTAAQEYITNNKIGIPDVSLDVSFEQLAQTKEYELYALLEEVRLCDTVRVEFPELGVSATAQCIKTQYDVLTDKYKKIELGSSKTTLATTIANQSKEIDDTISKTYLRRVVDDATSIISGNSGGYVVLRNSDGGEQPNEILIMNQPDIETATKVWRWNQNGLGYSDHGYSGPFGLAMTIDGSINASFITTGAINASLITTGSLNADLITTGEIDSIKVKGNKEDSVTHDIFSYSISPDGILFKKNNSAFLTAGLNGITLTGSITATSGYIGDTSNGFTIGSSAIYNGVTSMSDTTNDGVYLGTDGIRLGKGKFSVSNAGALTASSANITGSITATSGYIGSSSYGFVIRESSIYNKLTSMSDTTHDGVYIGTDGIRLGKGKFSVTKAGALTATSANITGTITATSGYIGNYFMGFVINSTSIYNTITSMDDPTTNNGIYIGTDGIRLGANGKFSVTKAGALTATSADITGTITATSGYIGNSSNGFTIGSTAISNGITSMSDTTHDGIYLGTDGIRLGKGKFSVTNAGVLTASSGTIAGLEITTETRHISGQSVDGKVMKTDDSSFEIFAYNDGTHSGSSIDVKSINIEEPTFKKDFYVNKLVSSRSVDVGMASLESECLCYNGRALMFFDYSEGSTQLTATLSHAWNDNLVTINITKNGQPYYISGDKTFSIKVHYTWGNWTTKSITVYSGNSSGSSRFTEAFWGFDDAYFVNSGSNSYTYSISGSSYIDVCKNIEPFTNNAYDLGSNTYKWRDIYSVNGHVGSSDRNEKKDISLLSDQYSKLFDKLKPVMYRFIQNSNERLHIGFIAQDIKESMDEIGMSTKEFAAYCDWIKNDGTTGYGLRYSEFIALNTFEIQKLKRRVNELERQLYKNQ